MITMARYQLLLVTLVFVFGSSIVWSQGTYSDSLVLRNTGAGQTTLIPNPAVPAGSPWYLTLPSSQGTSNSLLVSTVAGNNAELSWLPAGANNTVLTIVGGTPQWVAGDSWLLLGNAGVNEAINFLGTQDANDLILRSNNLIRVRVNQEFNQSVEVTRPTSIDGVYEGLRLTMNFENAGGFAVPQDNTRAFINNVDWGTAGPGGAAQVGTLYANWTQLSMLRGAGHTYNSLVGSYNRWVADNAASIASLTGYWSERSSAALNHTVSSLYHFRAELPGDGTVSNLFGFHMGTPLGTLNNVVAFSANNIPTGAGNRYFLAYNATGSSQPFAVSADGSITSGTLIPLAGSRMLITNLTATSSRAVDIDMTGTTTSSGLVVREIGATGSNDAGILIGTAAAGTGTGIRISGVAGFNSPNTGIDMVFSSSGLNANPRTNAAGIGVSVGTVAGNRARIGGEFYARASAANSFGVYTDVSAAAAPASLGIGAYLSTTGLTGSMFPLVVASENNNDVYLGSTSADRPAPLGTLLTGAATQNTTYMFNTRISGVETFVGSTSGTVSISAPASVTSHSYLLPTTQGVVGAALRIQSVAGVTAQLAWTSEPPAPAPLFAYVAADQTFNAASLSNVTGLVLTPLVANTVYEFEAIVAYDGLNVGADLQIAFVTTNTTFIRWSAVGNGGASVAPVSVVGSGTAMTDIPTNATSFGADMGIHIKGMLIVGATDGTIQMQAGTTTAGNQVRILQGTFLKATRMTN